MAEVKELNESNFDEEVLKASTPVLVDFYAKWCGPCRMQGPIMDEVAKAYGDKVKVAKIDVDEAQAKAMAYGVSSIPALILFKGGKALKGAVGLQSKESISEILDASL